MVLVISLCYFVIVFSYNIKAWTPTTLRFGPIPLLQTTTPVTHIEYHTEIPIEDNKEDPIEYPKEDQIEYQIEDTVENHVEYPIEDPI